MPSSTVMPLPQGFNLNNMVSMVVQIYQQKGFAVTVTPFETGVTMDFLKDKDGIKQFVGLTLGIRATVIVSERLLTINFTNPEWTSKIIGFAVGWACCFITAVTAIIGTVQQIDLPNSIGNDIQVSIGGR